MDVVYYVVGFSITIISIVGGSMFWLGRKLAKIDEKFKWVDERFKQMDERLQRLEKGYEELKNTFTEFRMWTEKKFTEVEKGLAEVRGHLVEFEERFDSFADSVRGSVVSMNSLVVEFLGLKGLLSREEVGFLSREASRLALAIRPNPITEEEVEFLRRVFSKPVEEMTVEELEKAAEIAKRWWYREGKEEAYRLFLIAWTIRTYKVFQEPREKGRPAAQQ